MKSYYKLSKEFYTKMFTEYLAYEMYLDTKYHKRDGNTIYQILNTCFDGWVISNKEKEVMITNAKIIFKEKYELKS